MEFKAKKKTMKVTVLDGTSYDVAVPSVGQIETLNDKLQAAGDAKAIGVYREFFAELGLPDAASKSFDYDDFLDFVKFVMSPKKEKPQA
jgi:hypothetical protein